MRDLVVLIPAYQPGAALPRLIAELRKQPWLAIVVVDDGNGAAFPELEGVEIVRHAVNRGKGAALKTGINHVMFLHPEARGVITADADGQHAPEDIVRVAGRLAREPEALVLGIREFDRTTPRRSRIGNRLASIAVRMAIGVKIADTQTGLRGIPRRIFARLLTISADGYEFELEMITAAVHAGTAIAEEPIRTIYEEDNRGSHFNPFRDSMRISFVLARFAAVSLMTALIDNAVFWAVYPGLGGVGRAQVLSRIVAMTFQYPAARHAVFLTDEPHLRTLPKYAALVLASGIASYGIIDVLAPKLGVFGAKLAAESALFLANFAVSRDFVFTRRTSR